VRPFPLSHCAQDVRDAVAKNGAAEASASAGEVPDAADGEVAAFVDMHALRDHVANVDEKKNKASTDEPLPDEPVCAPPAVCAGVDYALCQEVPTFCFHFRPGARGAAV
jgi:hypothetical protein